jgi:signal transduction histidine kinase
MHRVVVLGILAYCVALLAALPELWQHSTSRRVVGWTTCCGADVTRVTDVDRKGPASGILRRGDQILRIEDETSFPGFYRPFLKVWNYPPGARYSVRVLRAGQTLDLSLQIGRVPDRSDLPLIWCYLFASITFLAIGVLLGWKRPDLRAARFGWLACELTALTYLDIALEAVTHLGWPRVWIEVILGMIGLWNILAAWWFVAEFPFGVNEGRWWRAVRAALVTLVALENVNTLEYVPTLWTGYRFWGVWPAWLSVWNTNTFWAARIALVSALAAVIIRNYRRHRDPAVRRRIEIVAGSILFGVSIVSGTGVYQVWSGHAFSTAAMLLANLAPIPIPLCFYYTVLNHQVFDIRIAIRRSLQYLFAKNALRVMTLSPVVLLAIRMLGNPNAPIGSLLNMAGIALIVASGLCLEFRTRILGTVDRWFFRSAIERENLLRVLLVEIARLGTVEDVVAIVPQRLGEIFEPESIEISAECSVSAPSGGLCLPIRAPAGSSDGCLVLGPKKSEEPYSHSERDLLEAVAAQVGLVRESLTAAEGRLHAVLEERNRIARELHDTLSQGFAGISLHLEAARKAMAASPEQARESLDEARTLARHSMQEARESLRDLRASNAGSHLEVRLRALAERSPEVPRVSVEIPEGIGAMASADAGWHLARIAEEAVTNAFKHARATRVDVELKPSGSQLLLRVCDDGAGFDPAHSGNRGFGLLGMRERISQLRGSVEIISAPGKGTEVRAMVPSAV